jgi:phage baseplate assembly protein W
MPSSYGYSPRILPFAPDERTGFTQNLTLKDVAAQNLINLILCCPGERIMYDAFGVGLRHYLFEQNTRSTRSRLKTSIINQTAQYLPYINIRGVSFSNTSVDEYLLGIQITYSIKGVEATLLGQMTFNLSSPGEGGTIVSYGYDDETGTLYSSTYTYDEPVIVPELDATAPVDPCAPDPLGAYACVDTNLQEGEDADGGTTELELHKWLHAPVGSGGTPI